jgi:pimeloyl-ACP methyl ester carboxylesterase
LNALLWSAAALAVVFALGWAHVAFWTRVLRRPWRPDELHHARTADGWRIALSRIRPAPDGEARGAPVIMCHGICANARFFDFDERLTLSRDLAAVGFDVWMLDLRGSGASEKGGWRRSRWDYGLGEFVEHDSAAAVEFVRGHTGRDDVHWVGHSMGGLIGYRVALRGDIASLVTIGSPGTLSHVPERLGRQIHRLYTLVTAPARAVRSGISSWALAPYAGWIRLPLERFFFNPDRMDRHALQRLMIECTNDVPSKLTGQFDLGVQGDLDYDGRPLEEVRALLAGIQCPVLAIAGDRDAIAPPDAVRAALTQIGDASIEVFEGFGHCDLLTGEGARETVYARIEGWLHERVSERAARPAVTDAAG